MPLHDYRCENDECPLYNQTVEHLVRDTDCVLCDKCGDPMNRLVSAPHGRVVGGATNNHKINKKRDKSK